MFIYNVTTNIEENVHDEWVNWMKNKHIPSMLNTGKFVSATMSRVDVVESMGGITYSVQYKIKDKATLERYFEEDAEELRAQTKPFEGQFVSFKTEMEIVHEQ
ncbi:DUF4286 family protein [Psychroflexus sp. CAK57W]|uniref:DUF4286 family protein n=1 Tax=Psychroflexus curvus TaxID=2873595 RepID=UPI001CCC472C|nr:DUF4286 family protein [Psychroflexus curvus]MBZ9628282.1 DUF4286 family protein [Psychroflexus curvus]MBZ9788319.1 DUF4286 family protein [Psychroflexus curvus]